MNKTIAILYLILLTFSLQSFAIRVQYDHCVKEDPNGAFIYAQDYKWGYGLPEMLTKFVEMYGSEKRLMHRAYYDASSQNFKIPLTHSLNPTDVPLTLDFAAHVATHVEEGFKRKVIDAVFFPDMGHSHFLIPQDVFDQKYKDIPTGSMHHTYEPFFQEPSLKILYHTAEQLQLVDKNNQPLSPTHEWRFKTRNLVGQNNASRELEFLQNPESNANTANGLEGYRYWGAGFNISANKNGCFSYEKDGEIFYFDLSLSDPPYTGPDFLTDSYN